MDANRAPGEATTNWEVVTWFRSYEDAQRAVDRLSDAAFPVENVEIVGRDVRIVERVTGRLTTAGAAMAGGLSGAWFGLFVGVLIGLFSPVPAWLALVATGIVLGALTGAVFGFVAHWRLRGQRDFASVRSLGAERYEIRVAPEHAEQARKLLS